MGKPATFRQHLDEHRRRAVLHVLADSTGGRANNSIISVALDRIGLGASHDLLQATLEWLAELGLVELEKLGDFTVVSLTRRGLDVAERRADVPGIARRYD